MFVNGWYGEECQLVNAGINIFITMRMILNRHSILSRIYTDLEEFGLEEKLEFHKTLKVLNLRNRPKYEIRGMVMGHSPQFMYNRPLNSDCNNKLWRVDIGMSRAFGKVGDSKKKFKYY